MFAWPNIRVHVLASLPTATAEAPVGLFRTAVLPAVDTSDYQTVLFTAPVIGRYVVILDLK